MTGDERQARREIKKALRSNHLTGRCRRELEAVVREIGMERPRRPAQRLRRTADFLPPEVAGRIDRVAESLEGIEAG